MSIGEKTVIIDLSFSSLCLQQQLPESSVLGEVMTKPYFKEKL